MKDLKHLYYFENLLQEANNELVQKAKAEGRIALGNVCAQIPEPLQPAGLLWRPPSGTTHRLYRHRHLLHVQHTL